MDLPTPLDLKRKIPLTKEAALAVESSRKSLIDLFEGKDQRTLLVVGPCSIHCMEEGLHYARKLKALADSLQESCLIIMRAYIEKPRSRIGWKGLVHDPHLNGSHDVVEGLYLSRKFLVDLAHMGMPIATEFLTPHLAPYIEDTVTWGCIGARTSSSQIHRLLASSLAMPVGFKNSVDGNIDTAIGGVEVAQKPHTFLHLCENGKLTKAQSKGNPYAHVVLRGSLTGPNYDEKTILQTIEQLKEHNLPERILVDCSHGNSGGRYYQQREAFESVLMQIQGGNRHILGMMLESNLEEGKQPISAHREGISVTDGCLDFSSTAALISSVSSPRSMSLTHS